jgi:hypothetical protein
VPPSSYVPGSRPAGIAWMDTSLLSARLYSGSGSPGGGPYRYTAPVTPAQAETLVAAFNGGFKMNAARGGYYTEGRMIDPLRTGAASLVIYADGSVDIGAWGSDVTMTPQVVSVRQNLVPLVAGGRPTPRAASANWRAWGSTCAATSCGHGVPGVEYQWRSGLGITADGALVYAVGPALDPLQLAQLLVRAGVVRGMQLDINPAWPVFVTYDPPAGRPGCPGQRRQAAPLDRAGSADVLRGLVGARLRHDVSPSRPLSVSPARRTVTDALPHPQVPKDVCWPFCDGLFPGGRPTAPMAGARVSHRPMVTTIEVTYPNGRMPTSVPTMPAKIIKIHALTKNNGPAAMSLKNAPMTFLR